MPEIVIQVQKDGDTQISVNGVSGPGCQDLTNAIEAALGQVQSRECTVEYYLEAPVSQEEQAHL